MHDICVAPIEKLVLKPGLHSPDSGEYCAVEAAVCRYTKGEKHSDNFRDCNASPVVTRLAIRLNDRWDGERRQQLLPFVDRIPNTVGTREQEIARAFMCTDWACRGLLPSVMEARGRKDWATKLRGLAPVVSVATSMMARDLAREARNAFAAARADAEAAAYAAERAAAAAYVAAAAAYAYAAEAEAATERADAVAYAAVRADAVAAVRADAVAAVGADAVAAVRADAVAAAVAYAAERADAAAYAAEAAYAALFSIKTIDGMVLSLLDRLIKVTEAPERAE